MATRRPGKSPKRKGFSSVTLGLAALALLLTVGGTYWLAFGGTHAPSQAGSEAGRQAGGGAAAQAAANPEEILSDTAKPAGERATHFVAAVLKAHRVVIFSKSYCPYSMKGKDIMRRHLGAAQVHLVELDHEPAQALMTEIQDELRRQTGARTVPRIFVDGQCIGGADDAQAKDASGELATLLGEKGLTAGAQGAADA